MQQLERQIFSELSPRIKQLFVTILFALKEQRPKIRLALINFNALLNRVVAEDAFIGLEIDAHNAMKLRQANFGETHVVNLD